MGNAVAEAESCRGFICKKKNSQVLKSRKFKSRKKNRSLENSQVLHGVLLPLFEVELEQLVGRGDESERVRAMLLVDEGAGEEFKPHAENEVPVEPDRERGVVQQESARRFSRKVVSARRGRRSRNGGRSPAGLET